MSELKYYTSKLKKKWEMLEKRAEENKYLHGILESYTPWVDLVKDRQLHGSELNPLIKYIHANKSDTTLSKDKLKKIMYEYEKINHILEQNK